MLLLERSTFEVDNHLFMFISANEILFLLVHCLLDSRIKVMNEQLYVYCCSKHMKGGVFSINHHYFTTIFSILLQPQYSMCTYLSKKIIST